MRIRFLVLSTVVTAVTAGMVTLSADRVRLRSGQSVTGDFMSGDSKVVRVLLANGKVAEFSIDDVTSVEFSSRKPAPAPAAAVAPARAPAKAPAAEPDPARAPAPINVPKGTVLSVILTQDVDVDKTQTGMKFKSILDDPVMIGGNVVIPRNSAVVVQAAQVEQAGNVKGSDKISLKANTISFGGKTYDIVTSYAEKEGESEGKKSSRRMIGGAGLGAAIGGIAGGGKGVAIGALAGFGAGAVASAVDTDHLKLPAETRLQFKLTADVTVQP
jgi:hypothetical protein